MQSTQRGRGVRRLTLAFVFVLAFGAAGCAPQVQLGPACWITNGGPLHCSK